MTNPTPPLTAEEIVDQYSSVFYEHDTWMDYLISDIKAYAAQQNAELVATISQLNSDIAGLKAQLKDAEINFEALADGTIRDQAIGMLRAENERLKQQLAWQPIETAPKDKSIDLWVEGQRFIHCYFDAICKEYRTVDRSSVLIRLRDATHWRDMPQPPKEAT